MIFRARAPLRISLAGGGTDVSPYSENFGGRVVNTTIDKYAYAIFEESEASSTFQAYDPSSGELVRGDMQSDHHPSLVLARGVHEFMVAEFARGRELSVAVTTQSDAPPGSGLGASSALVVALVAGFDHLYRLNFSRAQIASLARKIERQFLGFSGGWQDFYSAAFGGFNYFEEREGGEIEVSPLRVDPAFVMELEASCVLHYSGVSRDSSRIIETQSGLIHGRNVEALSATHAIRALVEPMRDHILAGNFMGVVDLVKKGAEAKKSVGAGVYTTELEQSLEEAYHLGAYAGKVSGAGGGGFLVIFGPASRRNLIGSKLGGAVDSEISNLRLEPRGVAVWEAAHMGRS